MNRIESSTERSVMRMTRSRRLDWMPWLMTLLVLFSGIVQAEPNRAAQYLQLTKNEFQLTKAYYQVGRNYAVAGNAAAARSYFQYTYTESLKMLSYATSLHQENLNTLASGQYRNLAYQQLAVSYSDELRSRVSLLKAQLSILVQTPLSLNARTSVDISIMQITQTLLQLEQAMLLAQS